MRSVARTVLLITALAAGLSAGCSDEPEPIAPRPDAPTEPFPEGPKPEDEPARVAVLECLIGFQGTGVPGAARTRAEARNLAFKVLALSREGAEFSGLVRLHGDRPGADPDADPAPLRIANAGVAPNPEADPPERGRGHVPRGLGDAAFAMKVGDVRVVEWSERDSPDGYRVVMRVE